MSYKETLQPIVKYNARLHDVYIDLAANVTKSTWASNMKSSATPSVRLAGIRDLDAVVEGLTPTVGVTAKIQHLLAFGLISTLGSLTYNQITSMRNKAAVDKPRVFIRASKTLVTGIQGSAPLHIPPAVKELLFTLLDKFEVEYEEIPYDPNRRDFVTSELNRFASRLLEIGNLGRIVPNPEYLPQAGSVAKHYKRTESNEHPTAKLEPLTPNGFFRY